MISFLDLLFPKRCLSCGKWGRYMCSPCRQSVKPLSFLKCPVCERPAIDGMTHPKCQTKYSLDGLTSFFRYDGVIKKAITHIKYRYASDIVEELICCIPDISFHGIHTLYGIHHTAYLIPIPLHQSRYNVRGFNQAEVIAQVLYKRLHIPVCPNLLMRKKNTTAQVDMKDRNKRLANMKDVFAVSFPELKKSQFRECEDVRLHDHVYFLIDDVFTTGATLRSAASVLKHAGAKFVWGITVAQ